jgi:hypothetical protein
MVRREQRSLMQSHGDAVGLQLRMQSGDDDGDRRFRTPGPKIGALMVPFLRDPDGFTVDVVHRPPRHFAEKTGVRAGAV